MASMDKIMDPDTAREFGKGLRQRIDHQIADAVNEAVAKAVRSHRVDSEVETRLAAERLSRVEAMVEKLGRIPTQKEMDDRIHLIEDAVERFDKRRDEVTADLRAARNAEGKMTVLAKGLQDTMREAEAIIAMLATGMERMREDLHDVAGRAARVAVEDRVAALQEHAQRVIADEVERVREALTAMQGEEDGPIGIGQFHGPYDPEVDTYKRGAVVVHKGATYIAATDTGRTPFVGGPEAPWRLMQPPPAAAPPAKGKGA